MMPRVRWADGAWALLVLLAAVLMSCGLAMTFSLIVRSPTEAEGQGLIFLGSLAFGGSAVWAGLSGRPLWETILTALVVGGLAMEMPDGLLAHLAAMGLVPAALTSMLVDLLAPGGRRAEP
ncbi:hypothetical protein [Arthrobacter sp. SO3]|uniref:hypothetical protein n=1 Tax=Arthrobacter sp. SO3 TaxID=1897057 RepID=UPI001CFFC7BF|nr:hypothetical protein [Arthrobacter sp. SO3]MCB5291704.1 hypothetical protein [Arthrobacter sp. SO3]